MGYIREPKNIDLVVGPSVLTEDTKKRIAQAIAKYKKSGHKAISVEFVMKSSLNMSTNIGHARFKQSDIALIRRKPKL